MIPFVARISVRRGTRHLRLWIPLAIVWLLLLPALLLLIPLGLVACVITRVDPLRAAGSLWSILCGVQGSEIEFENSGGSVSIYVF